MKRSFPLLLFMALAACGQAEAPTQVDVPTVDELAADPKRLRELRQQCRTDHANTGQVLCNRVAEATRKRFYGDGEVPYTPPESPPTF
ncbi:EexN family lipoprotein [Pseudomonas aeruginosa]|uniref:EexN family lipoprotein n=1 Tax=Stutzerimonas stutzeri TaxID=316 RepID=UPI001A330A42|nr:EexN family lipoprotein [Stutzerimonas stutzeri]MBG7303415.1 EexN family lipoprotein [Pseudomonas aeruginosa]GBC54761.1 probable lipoprotein [Stutzerimonas stutzeri]HBP6433509.1 entry exclusion lipoprotein TrbK [Pseudomonas aeruginosa]